MSRQIHAVPHSPITTSINEALYVELNLPSEVAFNLTLLVNDAAEMADLLLRKVLDLDVWSNLGSCQNRLAQRRTNAIDILQGYLDWFALGKIYPSDACH